MTPDRTRIRYAFGRLSTAALALAVAAVLGACGEKEEPDLSTVPVPAETVTDPAPTTPTKTTPPATPVPKTPTTTTP